MGIVRKGRGGGVHCAGLPVWVGHFFPTFARLTEGGDLWSEATLAMLVQNKHISKRGFPYLIIDMKEMA